MMSGLSIWHWLVVLAALATALSTVVPPSLILRKAGFSGWWALLMLIPFVGYIAIWVFALTEWPIEKPKLERAV